MKYVLDLVLSGIALLLLSPVFLLVALLVRINLGSPVLFRQTRPGMGERPFELMKFRTMTDKRGSDGALLPDGLRLSTFGRFLRKTSLDELPELMNVLRGEMSLVGPRPLLMRYLPYFTDRERVRFRVRPGITGLAQISGRNNLGWNQRLAKDVEYVEQWRLTVDFKIMVLTLWRVLIAKDVQVDSSSALMDFDEERALMRQENVRGTHAQNAVEQEY